MTKISLSGNKTNNVNTDASKSSIPEGNLKSRKVKTDFSKIFFIGIFVKLWNRIFSSSDQPSKRSSIDPKRVQNTTTDSKVETAVRATFSFADMDGSKTSTPQNLQHKEQNKLEEAKIEQKNSEAPVAEKNLEPVAEKNLEKDPKLEKLKSILDDNTIFFVYVTKDNSKFIIAKTFLSHIDVNMTDLIKETGGEDRLRNEASLYKNSPNYQALLNKIDDIK